MCCLYVRQTWLSLDYQNAASVPVCTKFHSDAPVGKMNALKGRFVNTVAQNVSPSCQILMLLLNPPALFLCDDLSEVDSPEFYTGSAAA